MLKDLSEMKSYIKDTLRLTGKSLYKTVEFQLLFKAFYISTILIVVNFIISLLLDTINLVITKIQLGETLQDTTLLSILDLPTVFFILTSLLTIIYIYPVEKNGIVIITSEYQRNNFISFFKTLLLSIRRTPLFIFRRIYEMRLVIITFVLIFILWRVLSLFTLPSWIITTLAIFTTFYGAAIFFSILFRYTFTAHITCLEPQESPENFNKNLPPKFLKKRTYVSVLFYFILLISVILWTFLFYVVIQILLTLATTIPSLISTATAFFVAFTIVSILITLSLLKTFKVSLMTVLYYEERKRQDLPIMINSTQKQPLLSRDIRIAAVTIFSIALIGGTLLTTSIKTKTDQIITNAEEYAKQLQEENFTIDLENFTIQEIITNSLSQESTSIDTIERIVFTYLIFIIDK